MARSPTPVLAAMQALEEAEAVADAADRALVDMVSRRNVLAADLQSAISALNRDAATVATVAPESNLDASADVVARLKIKLSTFDDEVLPSAKRSSEIFRAKVEEARRQRDYVDANVATDEATRHLIEVYPKLVETFQQLKARVEKARHLVEVVNANLPAGMSPILDSESRVRDQSAREAEVISEAVVDRWVFSNTKQIIADPEKVTSVDGRTGRVPITSTLATTRSGAEVEMARVRRREVRAALPYRAGPRLSSVVLPPLSIASEPAAKVEFDYVGCGGGGGDSE